MDLKTERNLEMFFRMLGVSDVRLEPREAPRIELAEGALRVFVEVRDERVVLSAARSVDAPLRDAHLQALLGRWSPARTHGIPVRVFQASDYLFVSSTLPKESGADTWFRTYRVLRGLLDLSLRDNR